MKLSHLTYGALLGLGSVLLLACKDDPPPPPPVTSADAKKLDPAKLAPPMVSSGRLSMAAMKRFRVEACYFGSVGLQRARADYLKSLGGAAPGPGKIPSFAGETKPGSPAIARRGPMFRGNHLTFARHVRSCTVAQSINKGSAPEFDKALNEFAPFARELNKKLIDVGSYYGRKHYEKDQFKKGKELHKRLESLFAELDSKLENFGKAVSVWQAGWAPLPEKLDKLAELSFAAVDDARSVAMLCLSKTVDAASLDTALKKLEKSREALKAQEKEGSDISRLKSVLSKLDEVFEAASKAKASLGANKKLSPALVYPVASAMANTVEANHRALSKMVRRRGAAGSPAPLRLSKPRINHVAPLSKDKARLSVKPSVANPKAKK